MAGDRRAGRPLAFLFLGETLLIPHLYPILEAVAASHPALPIDAWTATETHEVLIRRWLSECGLEHVRLRRAPGWRRTADPEKGVNPQLPAKLPMLARLAPSLIRARAVVCAEQTSLWLPRLFPGMPPFIKTSHGVGSTSARDDRRRFAAALTLVPSEAERATYLDRGMDPARIVTTGYVKAGFRHLAASRLRFARDLPAVLYNPHWQRHRSSWWSWGREAVASILGSGRYNLIFAPHQRLAETSPGLREFCASLSGQDDCLCDLDSFAAVDGSYPGAADIYVGDTSSQVLEFLQRPRPVIFLNPGKKDWRADPSLEMWQTGEVIDRPDGLLPAIDAAARRHEAHIAAQRDFTRRQLGDCEGAAPERAAAAILRFLR
jgi:hypothetical protein